MDCFSDRLGLRISAILVALTCTFSHAPPHTTHTPHRHSRPAYSVHTYRTYIHTPIHTYIPSPVPFLYIHTYLQISPYIHPYIRTAIPAQPAASTKQPAGRDSTLTSSCICFSFSHPRLVPFLKQPLALSRLQMSSNPHDFSDPNRQGQYPPPQWNTSQPEDNPSAHYPPASQYPVCFTLLYHTDLSCADGLPRFLFAVIYRLPLPSSLSLGASSSHPF